MKMILLAFFSIVVALGAAEPTYSPQEAISKFGSFSITDGSSYFTFSNDGKFKSGPMGMSGRELSGTWTIADKTELTVIAQVGWMNGWQPQGEYRRIVFRVSNLRKRPAAQSMISMGAPTELFDSYCLIEEFVKTPKPKEPNTSR